MGIDNVEISEAWVDDVIIKPEKIPKREMDEETWINIEDFKNKTQKIVPEKKYTDFVENFS